MKRTGLVYACLVLLPLLGLAQDKSVGITAKVDFGFYVGGHYVPAGPYEFKPMMSGTESTMSVLNTQTKDEDVVPVVTTISKRTPADAEVVFDRMGDDYYLAEIYIPGKDGFLVKGASGKHAHVVVKANK